MGLLCYEENLMKDKNKWKVSLRSVEDEDTTPISKYFGGKKKILVVCIQSDDIQEEDTKMPQLF